VDLTLLKNKPSPTGMPFTNAPAAARCQNAD
jgi:hypothetical protein